MKAILKVACLVFIAFFVILAIKVEVNAAWPEKPITIVIQFKSGGGTDMITRTYAKGMEKYLGVTINAINRPGGQGSLAVDFVNSKPANGYWLIGASQFNKHMRVMGHSKLLPWEHWQYYKCANGLLSWAVKPESPIKTFADYLEEARKNPKKLNVAAGWKGGVWHEGNAIVLNETKGEVRHISYPGGAPSTLACLQGEVDAVASGLHEQIEFIRAGKLRNLAVFVKEPITLKSGKVLKPITEFVPNLAKYAPFGSEYTMAVQRKTPVEVLEKIKAAFIAAVNAPEFESLLKKKFFFKEINVGEQADRMAALRESVTAWLVWDLKVEGAKVNPAELGIPRPKDFGTWWPPQGYKPRITGR